jgi:hypothetical protein
MSNLKYNIVTKDFVVIEKSGVYLGLTLKQLKELQKLIPNIMIELMTTKSMEK